MLVVTIFKSNKETPEIRGSAVERLVCAGLACLSLVFQDPEDQFSFTTGLSLDRVGQSNARSTVASAEPSVYVYVHVYVTTVH